MSTPVDPTVSVAEEATPVVFEKPDDVEADETPETPEDPEIEEDEDGSWTKRKEERTCYVIGGLIGLLIGAIVTAMCFGIFGGSDHHHEGHQRGHDSYYIGATHDCEYDTVGWYPVGCSPYLDDPVVPTSIDTTRSDSVVQSAICSIDTSVADGTTISTPNYKFDLTPKQAKLVTVGGTYAITTHTVMKVQHYSDGSSSDPDVTTKVTHIAKATAVKDTGNSVADCGSQPSEARPPTPGG